VRRGGIERHQLGRNRADQVCRDFIPWERCTRESAGGRHRAEGVIYYLGDAGEISTFFGSCRHGEGNRTRSALAQSFVIREEEGLVALLVDAGDVNRSAAGDTKLVAPERRPGNAIGVIEEEVGVEVGIAKELERVPVKAAGTGLGDYVVHVTGAPAVFRGEAVRLDLRFL